jgi:hypothetical protein
MRSPPEAEPVAEGVKEIFPAGVFTPVPGSQNSGQEEVDRQPTNPKQVFRAGGSWPNFVKGWNYLNPGFTNHCLALAWVRHGDHQQKQHDGRGKNEQLVRH